MKIVMFEKMQYGPFVVQYHEDEHGQLCFTGEMDGTVLFRDVPYHLLAMSMVLVDRIVDMELEKKK